MNEIIKTNGEIEYCIKRLREMPIENDSDLIFQMHCTRAIMMMLDKWESNEPLTLEQLKQMDGETAWVEVKECSWIPNDGYFVLITGAYMITPQGNCLDFEDCLNGGWTLLRHKPVRL